jgi:hypothetical protein
MGVGVPDQVTHQAMLFMLMNFQVNSYFALWSRQAKEPQKNIRKEEWIKILIMGAIHITSLKINSSSIKTLRYLLMFKLSRCIKD